MSIDEVSPAQPAKKKYVRAVGPRLRWVLYFIFGAFALLSANSVYLGAITFTNGSRAIRTPLTRTISTW